MHGSLIIYLYNDLAYKELNNNIPISKTSKLFESLFLEIWKKQCHQKFVIGNIYRLPLYSSDDLNLFTNEFTDLLDFLRARLKTVLLCGDNNIELLKISRNDNFNCFYENVISLSFTPNITLPTRMCDTTSTPTDNIYNNALDKNNTCDILSQLISVHQMCFSMINLKIIDSCFNCQILYKNRFFVQN